jgi:signal transduction histidine kinase
VPLTRRDILPAAGLTAAVLVELALAEPATGSAVAALAVLALAVRRSLPVAAVAIPAAAIAIDAAAGGVLGAELGSPLAVMCLACLALGLHAGGWPRVALGATAAVGAMTFANQLDPDNGYSALDDLVFFALLLGAPAVVGQLLRRRSQLIAELASRAEALAAARAEQAAGAVAEERARVAIGVHDALAHRVGEISLQAAGAERVADDDPGRALQALGRIEDAARGALDDIREVIGVLRAGDEELALAPARAPAVAVPAPWSPTAGRPSAAGAAESRHVGTTARRRWTGGPRRGADAPADRRWAGGPRLDGDALLAAAVFAAIAIETLTSSRLEGPAPANLAGIALIAAPFAARRRAPLASAVAIYAATALQALLLTPPFELVTPIVILIVPAYSLAAHLPRRTALAGLAVCVAGTLIAAPAVPTILVALAAFGAGLAARDRARRVAELSALNAELQRTRDAHAARARGEERLRIARELHDAVAHSMTVIVLQAGAAQRVWGHDPAAARVAVAALGDVARATLAELRETLRGAPPARLGALEEIAARVRPLGVEVEIAGEDELDAVPPSVEQAAYAVVQEALTNAVRHAAPTTARVELRRAGDDLLVEVADSGRAPGPAATAAVTGTGSGLQGMAERVAAHGGELRYGAAGGGFRVAARLPLTEVAIS